MGAIEPWHLIVILAVVLIVLGPKRLPEVGREPRRDDPGVPQVDERVA